ncbi:PREDICTED: uncharacterized protein LOC108567015 [Nicrophorus vespilloides]|uniref:Uncharacterized protein LOC108567015 n=1 Tax=Nicrophorus vespilloides TaxID=110193 RepID=A0ABM1N786_NICVS|nr:PREDICTED: uncharacterized protein LOC108567015 [Nicrophorus vespilloides]
MFRLLQFSISICLVFAFEEILAKSEHSNEMLEQGKIQYQLLQERGALPKFGLCWKQAVEHIDEGCRQLSEETQSEISLHLTNCFLEMSGHKTYDCELSKKPNVRAICINSMSDRAFNVYTEFYSHTQNMCWFLRGQIWHETISENTQKVGKQLELSARNQMDLLLGQRESLEMQKKLIDYGKDLENIMGTFLDSARKHQELLLVMSNSLNGLQSWLFGEVSWWDSIVFYVTALIVATIFTSSNRTSNAKFPLLGLVVISIITERSCINVFYRTFISDIIQTQTDYYSYVWYFRYLYIFVSMIILTVSIYKFKDYNVENNTLLVKLDSNMLKILDCVSSDTSKLNNRLVDTSINSDKFLNNCYRSEDALNVVNDYLDKFSNRSITTSACSYVQTNFNNSTENYYTTKNTESVYKPKNVIELKRYNLRSRQNTPDKASI